jgi:predicted lipoprotein with Yx(FWY)xxD motif
MCSRSTALAAAALALALSAAACASSPSPRGTSPSAALPTIKASYMSQFNTEVLTDNAGLALYIFQPDRRQRVTCTGSCAAIWPPVFISHGQRPAAGPNVQSSLLGSDPYSGNRSVVTYSGWPLYTYISDTTAGAAVGQGLNLNGGYWYVIRPDGVPIVPPGDPPAT